MTKNFILLLVVALLVFINFFSFVVVIPLYVIDLNGSEFHVGFQNALFYISAILFRGYFGPLADVKGRRLPLFIGILAFSGASALFLISNNLWHIYGIRIFQSIGLAAFFSTGGSLVGDMAPPGKSGVYMGGYRLINTLALLLGPWIAISTINSFNYQAWFTLGAIIGLLALVIACFIEIPTISSQGSEGNVDTTFIDRFKNAFQMENARVIFLGTGIIACSLGILQTFASVYTEKVTEIANPGLYFTIFGIAGIIANVLSGYLTDNWGRSKVPWPFLTLMGLGLFIFALLPYNEIFFLLSSLIAGFGFGGGITALFTWTIEVSGEQLRATALSIQESAIDISIAMGSFIFGILVAMIDYSISFVFVGFVTVVLGVILMRKYSFSN
ncbi:MFS transporter [Natranaerobius thermophilus]|uniref:Major facilitator superfamily MFS_1 n=1 Tax=Natranaerobius thermophilus (strain ATCC BAA-1301 / DSM 18059 / JW/NM-WN-LF) TaxID=457570 RepID=B2A5S7_NATTJ|nr:MFS transporter [Natranaerobius thermophilus]ACB84020.1 major facilitator superfamily MFS_1 [Natranaerobius thermophilus JW/NM-WN-LF]